MKIRVKPAKRGNASGLHRKVLALLQEAFPSYTIHEEATLDAGYRRLLSVDLCMPDLKLCIEVHGRQHFEFVPHFHKSPDEYHDQQRRDKSKAQEVARMGYKMMVVRFDEIDTLTRAELVQRVAKAMKETSSGED